MDADNTWIVKATSHRTEADLRANFLANFLILLACCVNSLNENRFHCLHDACCEGLCFLCERDPVLRDGKYEKDSNNSA